MTLTTIWTILPWTSGNGTKTKSRKHDPANTRSQGARRKSRICARSVISHLTAKANLLVTCSNTAIHGHTSARSAPKALRPARIFLGIWRFTTSPRSCMRVPCAISRRARSRIWRYITFVSTLKIITIAASSAARCSKYNPIIRPTWRITIRSLVFATYAARLIPARAPCTSTSITSTRLKSRNSSVKSVENASRPRRISRATPSCIRWSTSASSAVWNLNSSTASRNISGRIRAKSHISAPYVARPSVVSARKRFIYWPTSASDPMSAIFAVRVLLSDRRWCYIEKNTLVCIHRLRPSKLRIFCMACRIKLLWIRVSSNFCVRVICDMCVCVYMCTADGELWNKKKKTLRYLALLYLFNINMR